MSEMPIRARFFTLALRTSVGSISLAFFYISLHTLGTFLNRIPEDDVTNRIAPPFSTFEIALMGFGVFLGCLFAAFIWSAILFFLNSDRPWYDFVIAIIVAISPTLPSIINIPATISIIQSLFPQSFWSMFLLKLSAPISLFLAASTTWIVVRQIMLRK